MSDAVMILVLATATPGGGFPVYGDAFCAVVNAQLAGEKRQLRIETRNTKGSTENLPLLEANAVDIALVAGELATEALARPGTPHRIVAAIYSSPGMLMVRPDSPARTLSDLRGKPVVLGTQASGITVLGRAVFRALDIEIREITLEKAADGPAMLMDARAAGLWGAGVGWPAFTALAKQGNRFIGPSADEIGKILEKNRQLQAVTLPAGSYPGQDAPLPSVGSWSYVFAKPGLSEEAGYLLARALHRGEAQLGEKLLQARETTMKNLVAAAPKQDLIHPGVRKYLREIGLTK